MDYLDVVKDYPLPVIANGDVFTIDDIKMIKERVGTRQIQSLLNIGITSFMLARGAQANPFVFTKLRNGLDNKPTDRVELHDVMVEYLKLCMLYDIPYQNAKYTLCQMSPPKHSATHREVDIYVCFLSKGLQSV